MNYAAKVSTSNGSEWMLCVAHSKASCKRQFCEWYARVDYIDIRVEYVEVEVTEKK